MSVLDIGEVSERTGVPPSTLRYYDEIGLISSIGRKGLRRQFLPGVVLQLTLIEMGKAANFSLDEIAEMFSKNQELDLSRPALHAKADDLDRQIRDLTALRDLLRHTADCPAPSHMECPSFLRLVTLAARRASKSGNRRRHKARPSVQRRSEP